MAKRGSTINECMLETEIICITQGFQSETQQLFSFLNSCNRLDQGILYVCVVVDM
jgi:hypothetical protein